MKMLQFSICALLVVGTVQTTSSQNTRLPRNVEIITPASTNLFSRSSANPSVFRVGTNLFIATSTNRFLGTNVFQSGTNFFVGSSTNRLIGTNVFAGSSTQLNTVALTNAGLSTPTNATLIGPVFPAPVTNLAPTGRSTGFEGLQGVGPLSAPVITNALGQVFTNAVPGSEVPGPSAPGVPPNTAPLAPPTAPNLPQPTTPPGPPNPNAVPALPSSPNPTPPNTTPLVPPGPPSPPIPPAPAPPAGPGGTGAP